MAAKPLQFTEKVAVSFTTEQLNVLRNIASETGETVSGLLRRLALQYIADKNK